MLANDQLGFSTLIVYESLDPEGEPIERIAVDLLFCMSYSCPDMPVINQVMFDAIRMLLCDDDLTGMEVQEAQELFDEAVQLLLDLGLVCAASPCTSLIDVNVRMYLLDGELPSALTMLVEKCLVEYFRQHHKDSRFLETEWLAHVGHIVKEDAISLVS